MHLSSIKKVWKYEPHWIKKMNKIIPALLMEPNRSCTNRNDVTLSGGSIFPTLALSLDDFEIPEKSSLSRVTIYSHSYNR